MTCSWIATSRDVDRAKPSHVGPLTSYAIGEVKQRLLRGFLCHNDIFNKDDTFFVI